LKALIVGSGGREHALAAKIAESNKLKNVTVVPGNPGMTFSEISKKIHVKSCQLNSQDGFTELLAFAREFRPDLVIIGPDNPLAEGVSDFLTNAGFKVFGPTQAASQLESSKSFAKMVLSEAGIKTPLSIEFSDYESAVNYLENDFEKSANCILAEAGVVIKANGLALGKGVSVCSGELEAKNALSEIFLDKKFGDQTALVEKRIQGVELSAFALCQGDEFEIIGTATDYKRRFEGNQGPNTGGMGAISPFPAAQNGIDPDELDSEIKTIFSKTLKFMTARKTPFCGFMFLGLMIEPSDSESKLPLHERINVIEYNVRMGDPETQCLLPRLDSDLFQMITTLMDPESENLKPDLNKRVAATVCAVSDGYPDSYDKGFQVSGYKDLLDSIICFAGVRAGADNELFTDGGRVLAVTSLADSYENALDTTYSNILKIKFTKIKFRNDIGSPWFQNSKEKPR